MDSTLDDTPSRIGTRKEWTTLRLELLGREKELNRLRDQLAEQRRTLPWVRLDKDYRFDGPDGTGLEWPMAWLRRHDAYDT